MPKCIRKMVLKIVAYFQKLQIFNSSKCLWEPFLIWDSVLLKIATY